MTLVTKTLTLGVIMRKKIYIAGPMTGYPGLNWAAFDEAEQYLMAEGWEVINPASLDREEGIDPDRELGCYDYEECARRDISALRSCDAIYLMRDWQFSKGACWERALAAYWNIPRYYQIPRP
jgi:nucleoside 2-deoxyribosyltransferase